MKDRELRDEIAREQDRLAMLDAERSAAAERVSTLSRELAAVSVAGQIELPHTGSARRPVPPVGDASDPALARPGPARSSLPVIQPAPAAGPPGSSVEKLLLFRSLFQGRLDVYPRYWENAKRDKSGYSPACLNDFVDGVCGKLAKPRIRCGDCTNQAFLQVTDRAILDHLNGRETLGVYPLLPDDTCWFVAADFDGDAWAADVGAFSETCRSAGLPVAVERSRSGKGAHAWFFFTSPVSAVIARSMAFTLITETMARRHQLKLGSYDRLFPNQDTMPRGGFGNLIALPFQNRPRLQGNTVFLDENFVPLADQWAYLASIRRLQPAEVDEFARPAIRDDRVIGLSRPETGDEADDPASAKPWLLSASRRRAARPIGPLPAQVRATFAQMLYVEKAGLSPAALNAIKRAAAFENPEFFQRQARRLPVNPAVTPRVIDCSELTESHVVLPRGCREEVAKLLRENGSALAIDDIRQDGKPIEVNFKGHLTPAQEEAARALLAHDLGIFVAPPGTGKTVVGAYLVAARARSTLVLVHRQWLLEQWVAQLSLFLGLDPKRIGRLGGGKKRLTGEIDVAMVQSLVSKAAVDDRVAEYGHVIVDECHHASAPSIERVLREIRGRFILGLTATLIRRDGHHPIAVMQCGPVRHKIDARSEAARHKFTHRLIARAPGFRAAAPNATIQELYSALAADDRRNRLILDDVIRALEEGRSPLLLTERIDHLDFFADNLRGFAKNIVVLRGGRKARERREVAEKLASIPDDAERLLIATGRFIGEGFDDARLDTLFLALPIAWKGTLCQYTGRLHRAHSRKAEVRIFDYVDEDVVMLKAMFKKRLAGYRAIGYARREAPLGYADPAEAEERKVRIEYEPGAEAPVDDFT